MPTWATILFVLLGAGWALAAARHTLHLRALRDLPPLNEPGAGRPPSVAVVIAARDEAGHIETAVRSFLRQDGVNLRVIVADDRSQDATPEIIRRLAGEDARVEHARIDALPGGWLGKCHALRAGAERAEGAEWIVFADADTELLAPDAVGRAVACARAEGADHLCLLPRMPARTRWARALTVSFYIGALDRLDGLNRDGRRGYFGVGAFSLVRADAYRAAGGHEPLRLEVLDDVNLGALMRRAGGRSRARLARDAVATTWGGSVPELLAVLEKNTFAAAGYRVWVMALVVLIFVVFWGAAVAGPIVAALTGAVAALAPTVGLA
ncbi:MAG: glycosyltransferase family 2 protein, partial [Planctomycetota bacterium]